MLDQIPSGFIQNNFENLQTKFSESVLQTWCSLPLSSWALFQHMNEWMDFLNGFSFFTTYGFSLLTAAFYCGKRLFYNLPIWCLNQQDPHILLISKLKKGHIFYSFLMYHIFQALNHFTATLWLFPNLSISLRFWQDARDPLAFLSFLLPSCLPSYLVTLYELFVYGWEYKNKLLFIWCLLSGWWKTKGEKFLFYLFSLCCFEM